MSLVRVLLVTAVAGWWAFGSFTADPPGELSDKTLAEWRDQIRPKADDLGYKSIDWLLTFWNGVMAAQKADKPILLYAMNGPPAGLHLKQRRHRQTVRLV